MAESKKVNFKTGLEKFLKIHCPSEKVDKSGYEILSKVLNDVNATIISHVQKKYSSIDRVNERTFHHCARSAINENFPENLKISSLSEAYKQLSLLESGCIVFGDNATGVTIKPPIKSTRDEIAQQRLELPVKQFKEGTGKLFRMLKETLLADFRVDSQALGSLAFSIQAFAKMVAKRTAETVGKKEELQPVDLKRVLAEYFGTNVLKFAISEANRCLVLYENGFLEFKPKKMLVTSQFGENIAFEQKLTANLKTVVKTMLNEIESDAEVSGLNYLLQILLDVTRYVVDNTVEKCKNGNISEMKEVELQQSVSETFPKELKVHALINSSRNIEKFQRISAAITSATQEVPESESSTGEIEVSEYSSDPRRTRSTKPSAGRRKRKPSKSPLGSKQSKKGRSGSPSVTKRTRSPKRSKQIEKRKPSKSPNRSKPSKKGKSKSSPAITGGGDDSFYKYADDMDQFSRVNISVEREMANDISQVLHGICDELIDISVSHLVNPEVLSTEETKSAVLELFPKDLTKHALSHASTTVFKYLDQIENS